MKKNEYPKCIRSNFEKINNPPGSPYFVQNASTSARHRDLHKVALQTRVKNGKYSKDIGHLMSIDAEHLFDNVEFDNDVEVILPNGRKYSRTFVQGSGRIDWYEQFRDKHGKKLTKNVEVLIDHPYNAYFPNNPEGREWAKDFGDYMFTHKKKYFDQEALHHFNTGIKFAGFSKRWNNGGLKRLHYALADSATSPSKVDYSEFKRFVNLKSELERKYCAYSPMADQMSFVFFLKDLEFYRRDLVNLTEKIGSENCRIDYFMTIREDYLDSIVRANGGKNTVAYTTHLLEIPTKLKKKAEMQIWPIEELLKA
jgi:hypothetical protein